MTSSHPYADLPERAFWRTAVAEPHQFDWQDIWRPKYLIDPAARIASAGSCFAQHIRAHLEANGFRYLDVERAPALMSEMTARRYGYGLFSARFQNIYTARQLLQLFYRAHGTFQPRERFWHTGGRWFDPFRPTLEPGGFDTRDECEASIEAHLEAVRHLFRRTQVFIFTMGLTEAWTDRRDGAVYPVCPGTAVGEFDPYVHKFVNFGYADVHADMVEFVRALRIVNPKARLLLTVSPVPLTATASEQHVLAATSYSKSTLRAVAGDLSARWAFVDYFPSYELVSSAAGRAMLFEPNLRSVNPAGVAMVMRHFFAAHPGPAAAPAAAAVAHDEELRRIELVCEDELNDVPAS